LVGGWVDGLVDEPVGWLSAGVVGLLGLHCQGPSRVGVNVQ
jgi:hypothetical protein